MISLVSSIQILPSYANSLNILLDDNTYIGYVGAMKYRKIV